MKITIKWKAVTDEIEACESYLRELEPGQDEYDRQYTQGKLDTLYWVMELMQRTVNGESK